MAELEKVVFHLESGFLKVLVFPRHQQLADLFHDLAERFVHVSWFALPLERSDHFDLEHPSMQAAMANHSPKDHSAWFGNAIFLCQYAHPMPPKMNYIDSKIQGVLYHSNQAYYCQVEHKLTRVCHHNLKSSMNLAYLVYRFAPQAVIYQSQDYPNPMPISVRLFWHQSHESHQMVQQLPDYRPPIHQSR